MIERVVLNGADVDLLDVFASVTIRHGRGSADDSPLASTATLSLVNITRELVAGFKVGDTLDVLLAGDVPRFRGRVTDAAVSGDALAITAVSSLSWLSRRKIGAVDWPSETWSARVARAFQEAGYAITWNDYGAETWADVSGTWAQPLDPPLLTIEVGDDDPVLALREASETTLGAYLGVLAVEEPAAIANLPDGTVLVQALSARQARDAIELDPINVDSDIEWSMVDEVENVIELTYAGGAVTDADIDSVERFEARVASITTSLSDPTTATTRAAVELEHRALPEWTIRSLNLLELDTDIEIGTPILVQELPEAAPASSYVGIVEGWEDHVEPGDAALEWTVELMLSAPRLSGYGLSWVALPSSLKWNDAGATTWREPEALLT